MKIFARTYLMLGVLAAAVSLNFVFIVVPLTGITISLCELSTNENASLLAWKKK